jgi:two-component sensor histidine kinase
MGEKGVRVLYVDDDPGIARLVQKALRRHGYEVEHAASGAEALARIDQGGIDAVALDHYMPGGTGLDVLAELAKRPEPPPVVYVTSSGDTGLAVAALKAGAADYVPKDVAGDFLELIDSAVEGAIGQARLRAEKEAAERAVRDQRDRAEMLLREVNHRVGNSLALVAALVRMQAAAVSDPAAIQALSETQARISAIANIHRRLYTSDDVRYVDASAYLANLIEELEVAMRDAGRPHAISLNADPVSLPTDKAVSLGVVVTELVTNAFKYAYPPGRRGDIRVVVQRGPNGHVDVAVEDDGVGWRGSGKPTGTGLGSRIIEAMAANLGSTVRFDDAHKGTRVVLTFSP